MSIQKRRAGIEGSHTCIAQQAAINARKPRHFGVSCRRQLRPIMPVIFKRPPKSRRIFRPGAIFGGIHHDLFRHAADIHTGAAPEAFFRNTHPRPMAGGNTRGAHPTRTTTNHKKIKIISHGNLGKTDQTGRFGTTTRTVKICTGSSCWLKVVLRISAEPRSGREREGATSSTSISTRSVSPG